MQQGTELARLTAGWPRAPLLDLSVLDEAAETLGIRWPDDYRALISEHDGVAGTIGAWYVVMTAADALVDDNRSDDDRAPGVVFIGSDGAEGRNCDRGRGHPSGDRVHVPVA